MARFEHIADIPKVNRKAAQQAARASGCNVVWSDMPQGEGVHTNGSIWSAEDSLSAFWDHYIELIEVGK